MTTKNLKVHSDRTFFVRFSLKKIEQIRRITSPNLSFLRPCVAEIQQIRFFLRNAFSLWKFCQGFQLETKFYILQHVPDSFLLSSLPAFPCGLRGQQFEIKPPHLTIFHHIHHFAWVKSQAIPSKILNVIGPSSSRLSNWSSPICFGM